MVAADDTLPGVLYRLRKRASLSVADVAEAMGRTKSTVYLWETAEGRIPVKQLAKLLQLYGASTGEAASAWVLRSVQS